MKIFAFDPIRYRAQFEAQGWVHIKGGIDAEFLAVLQDFARASLAETRLDSFAIKGKKEQSLYTFPPDVDFPDELFDAVTAVCGLQRERMTLSERHIQAYERDADPEPPAHKDRFPSRISIGLSIDIPPESQLVLYPYDERAINPFNTSAGFRRHLQSSELPEVVLKGAREVVLDDAAGDVVMFHGSSTWHLRRSAARSVNLYLKVNDFGCDPLGEDPRTPAIRERSRELLADGGTVGERTVVLSRRFDTVARVYTRNQWEGRLEAVVFGEPAFGITALQGEMIRSVDGGMRFDDLVRRVAGGAEPEHVRRQALVLVERGALDLV
jgi:hypothetical protein